MLKNLSLTLKYALNVCEKTICEKKCNHPTKTEMMKVECNWIRIIKVKVI